MPLLRQLRGLAGLPVQTSRLILASPCLGDSTVGSPKGWQSFLVIRSCSWWGKQVSGATLASAASGRAQPLPPLPRPTACFAVRGRPTVERSTFWKQNYQQQLLLCVAEVKFKSVIPGEAHFFLCLGENAFLAAGGLRA